jgi:hypothetical protein
MGVERRPEAGRDRFTVVAEEVAAEAWHLTVRELPDTWTVAFSLDELEHRARQRIALDLGCDPGDFDIVVEPQALFLERRAHRRNRPH